MYFFIYVSTISIVWELMREKTKILLKVLHKIRFIVYNCVIRLFLKTELAGMTFFCETSGLNILGDVSKWS